MSERDREWKALVDAGLIVEGIKLYRAQNNTTLREAKDVIDRYLLLK